MSEYALFNLFPKLESKIPLVELGNWPTPLQKLNKISAYLGGPDVYIKRDDLSNPMYGGNKARKLELILARAKRKNCGEIITAGGLGSHHVLAVTALGGALGFKIKGLLFCQPVNEHVRNNLLLDQHFGAELYFVKDYSGLVRGYLNQYLKSQISGCHPLLLMPGGTDSLSTIGYMNCMLELNGQLAKLQLKDPQAIFTAAGTGGTAAGLLAGLGLSGHNNSTVILHAVRVVHQAILKEERILTLTARALSHIAKIDRNIKALAVEELKKQLIFEDGYLGEGYGFSSTGTREAVTLFKELEGIELEECYTAKAAEALLDYCRRPDIDKGRPVIFIHTAANTNNVNQERLPDYQELPVDLHWCFTGEARTCSCGLQKQNSSFCANIRQPGWHWPG
jgi:1-aminocyclopropane-1-carboxylate deaminase/D-cysteine desulfhydrase-like pyridoxal-dependent ACC family enzyme